MSPLSHPLLRQALLRARRHARDEEGAIAILTLFFMIVLGLVLITTLWSIAYATGAYNELYAGTQAAAYAAVGQTTESTGNQQQLDFECGGGSYALSDGATACNGGGVMDAVDAVFATSFPAAQCGSSFGTGFGLSWTTGSSCSTVQLLEASGNPADYVEAFYVPATPGDAQSIWEGAGRPTCPYFASQEGLPTELVCWSAPDLLVQTNHFTSGVIVRTGVSIKLPGCSPILCPTYDIRLAVAASEAQS
jgi:Flp pilus assembly protein TadG